MRIALLLVFAAVGGAGCGGASSPPPVAPGPRPATMLPRSLATRELAFVRATAAREDHLYVARPDGSAMRRLKDGPGCKQRPIWSPDGSKIAYRFMPRCDYNADRVLIIDVDSGHRLDLSRTTGVLGNSPSWSPDGQTIAFAGIRARHGRPARADLPAGLYLAGRRGTRARRVTSRGLGEVQYPMWSPDGRAIAFQVSRDNAFAIYTIAPDGSGLRRLTRGDAYTEWPMWSPDSHRIAYGLEGESSSLWLMRSDGHDPHEIRSGIGVPANWAPGSWIVANCRIQARRAIGICALPPDGSSQITLLGGIEAGFAAWRPETSQGQ